MLQTLRSKILFYFLLISMIGILFVSFFIQWGFEESFKNYLDTNREKKIDRVVLAILRRILKAMAALQASQLLGCMNMH